MYSRNYYPEAQDKLTLPENYDGTAFLNSPPIQQEEQNAEPAFAEAQEASLFHKDDGRKEGGFLGGEKPTLLSGLFGKGGLFGNIGLTMPRIGTEEILIIATAAFLFFSKSGDRESALILLLLLFIN